MAGSSRKDATLVVRAKDEASKALDAITAAFQGLAGGTGDLQQSSKKTSSALGALVDAVATLDRTFKGISAPQKLATELDKAGQAIGRIEQAVAGSVEELGKLTAAQEKAAASTAELNDQSSRTAAAIEKQGKAVADARAGAETYGKAVKELEAAAGKLETRQRNIPKAIERATAATQKAQERFAALGKTIEESTSTPTKRLTERFKAAEVAVASTQEKLARLQQEQRDVAAAIEESNKAVLAQRNAFAEAEKNVEAQVASLTELENAAKGIGVSLKEAGRAQKELGNQIAETEARLESQNASLNKAQVEFGQFQAASERAAGAVQQFAGAARGALTQAIRQQSSALAQARKELAQQEGTVRDYAAALAATDGPTDKLTRSLAEARNASRQMRSEIGIQETALKSMQQALAAATDDYDSMIAAQKRFAATQATAGQGVQNVRGLGGVGAEIERARLAAAAAASTLEDARREAAEFASDFARIGPPTQAVAANMDRVRTAVSAAKAEMIANGTAAGQLDAIYRRAATGMLSLEQAQRQAGQVNDRLAASLARIKAESSSLAASSRNAGSAVQSVGAEAASSAAKVNGLADAWRKLIGEQRQQLSIAGRIRGQIIAMTTAYVGLFGVLGGIQRTYQAFAAEQAAQTRLTVAVGNADQVQREMDFIRRTADRLKLSFSQVANEYSKFAAATKGTSIDLQETRDIFASVSEAARVYKLDQEQVNGVFTALTQIASKGKIQLEELSGQLGDRLPGALQVLADGMGITTAQLLELTAAGNVSAERLVDFGRQLRENVAGALPQALQSAQAEVTNFTSIVEQMFLRLAKGGAMDGAVVLLREINEQLQSPEAATFIDRLSSLLGTLARALAIVAENWRLVFTAVSLLIGLKIASWVVNAGTFVGQLVGSLKKAQTGMDAVARGMSAAGTAASAASGSVAATVGPVTALGGAAGRARGAIVALGLSLRALTSATLVGAAITLVTTAIGYLVTGSDNLNEVMGRNQELLDKVANAFEASGGSVEEFRKKLEGVTEVELRASLVEIREELQGLKEDADSISFARIDAAMSGNYFTGTAEAREQFEQIDRLNQSLENGVDSVADYISGLEAIGKAAANESIEAYVAELIRGAREMLELEEAGEKTSQAITGVTGTTEQATGALNAMSGVVTEVAQKMSVEAIEATAGYQNALKGLAEYIPSLKAELESLKATADVNSIVGGLGFNDITPEIVRRAREAKQNILDERDQAILDSVPGGGKVSSKLFGLIYGEESYRGKAYNDGYGTPTIGYGSTRIRGRAVQYGDVVTKEEAMAQASADLTKLIAQIDAMVKVPLSENQRNALVSYAYNAGIGSLKRDNILQPLNAGNYAGAESAIRNGVMTSKGKFSKGLQNRRRREADLFASGADDPDVAAGIIEREQELTEEKDKQRTATAETILDNEAALAQQELINAGKEREAEIQKAIRDARIADPNITDAEIKQIEEQTGKLFDLEQAQKNAKKAGKEGNAEANAALAQANALYAQQQALRKQIAAEEKAGNSDKVAELQTQLTGVQTELQAAIEKAREMWEAIGGPNAQAKLTSLDTLKTKLDTAQTSMQQTAFSGQEINDMLVGGLTTAADSFAKSVAEGKGAWESARMAFLQFASDFLRQIAQMIIKQALFNALGAGGQGGKTGAGGAGGFLSSIIGALFHDGGIAGYGDRSRSVNPAVFVNAARYHEGGIAGLKPREVPAILEQGEEILDQDDPRHIANGGGSGGGAAAPAVPAQVKVVNAFDAGSFMSEALGSSEGEKVFMNFVRSNASAIRGMLG